jgi:hypothetical protein
MTSVWKRKAGVAFVVFAVSVGTLFSMQRVFASPVDEHVHHPEHWVTTEGGSPGQFTGSWDVKFDGSSFACDPQTPQFHGTQCRAIAWRDYRAVERFSAPTDSNTCTFFGKFADHKLTGTYHCNNGGPFVWTATIP